MAYGSVSGIEAMVPQVGPIGVESTPTETEAESWLDEGAAVIDRYISSAGYTIPISSSATLYTELQMLNNLYASAQVLIARGLDTVQGTSESRSDQWLARFYEQLDMIAKSDLTAAGATATSTGTRRRIRTLQIRRIDGYSGEFEGNTTEYENPSD